MSFTPHNVNDLFPLRENEVFVFSSNEEGKHGRGLALLAYQKAGAKYGQARGLQGQSYGIVTKDLRLGERSIPLAKIQSQVLDLYRIAKSDSKTTYYMPKIGCSLAGFSVKEMADLFNEIEKLRPSNIILPIEFS